MDPAFGRVSYTQFEFLYACQQGKKTWVIVVGEGCHRDQPPGQLDLPREAGHADPAGYQAERRQLQEDYLARLKRENHLRYNADNDTELQNIVLRLRDELGELRQREEEWLKRDEVFKDRTTAQLDGLAEAAQLTTEKIRAHLRQTVEETRRRELAEADATKDWKERQRLREAADQAHTRRLHDIEELAASFAEIEGRGTATSVFQEMSRILAEQGVDEAIAYVDSQRSAILQTVRARDAAARAHVYAAREQNRADLQVLLQTAALHQAKGQNAEARSLYADVLNEEPDWPEALHAAFWFYIDQGDFALVHTTLAEAQREYEEAQRLAQRLIASDPSNTEGQRDLFVSYSKLGDIARAQGQLEEAARAYGDVLGIFKKLAAADPSNTEWQRDLSVIYERLGDVAVAQGRLEEAARSYQDGLEIRKKLAASDPSNTEWQRDLSVSYNKLGDVARAQGKLEEAARAYGDGLAIRKKLAAGDLSNTEWQRDLSVIYNKLGDVAVAQGQLEEAARFYGDGLAIRKKLAESDLSNTLWQRDLYVSYWRLADLAERQKKGSKAEGYWKQAFEVLSGIDQRGLHLSPQDREYLEVLRRKAGVAQR